MMTSARSYTDVIWLVSMVPRWSRMARWTAEGSGLLRPHLRGNAVRIVSFSPQLADMFNSILFSSAILTLV